MLRAASSVLVLVLASCGLSAVTPPIPADSILEHIKFLASDELAGRGNGTEGLERAADYIAAEFKEAGLRPAGDGNDWFQSFELTIGVSVGDGNKLVVRGAKQSVALSLGASYLPIAATPNDDPVDIAGLPVVFAGYGISAPAFNYDDYEGLDVKGKAVLIFSHEPQENRSDSRLNGNRPLHETTLYAKAMAARTRGARALLVVSDPSHRVDDVNYRAFLLAPDPEDHDIPVLRVQRDAVAPLIEGLGLDGIAAMIDRDLTPRSKALAGVTVDYTQRLATNRRTLRNVVGILPGADDSRDEEAVVLGGHYDHVGLGGRFSSSPERTGEIHNGADDNASGIAALIEIGRAAAADRSRFPRSLVFVAFAGEERGLHGSAHYANNPPIPMSDTIAMLNLDMIGRPRRGVEVSGMTTALPVRAEVEAAARIAGIEVRPSTIGAGRSDDASFLDKEVPALHLFTGFHEDYHRPTDDWQRIDAPGTARVATFALELAARLAARTDKLRFAAP